MKKFWEKHDLFKLAGLMVLITVILTWTIPQGMFQGELTIGEITRVGIFDFFTYGLLGMYYFTVLVTFVFVLGGFYQVLSKTGGYQKLTDSIAKKFKGKETLFVLIVSLIIAGLTAVMNEYFVIMAFVPLLITILSKMKLDKITGFAATFGSILIGILGSIYTTKIISFSVKDLGVEYGTYMWVKLVMFAVAFIAFSVFNVMHIKKTLKNKKADELVDMFASSEVTKKNKVWPLALTFIIFALIAILAYLPWVDVWNITFFNELLVKINEFEILGSPVFAYLLGNVGAFGTWDIFGIQFIMLIMALVIKWIYKLKNEEFFTAFGEGFAKTGKLVILMLTAYLVLEFAVMFPVLPVIADAIMKLTDKFNVLLGILSGLVVSLFSVEYQYTVSLVGGYLATNYASLTEQIAIMLQSTYGLVSMFAPTSVILLMGLSYSGITYKEWFKYIWKFLIFMLLVIIILMLIIF